MNEEEFAWNILAIYKSINHLTVDLVKVKQIMTKNNYVGKSCRRVNKLVIIIMTVYYNVPVNKVFFFSSLNIISGIEQGILEEDSVFSFNKGHLYNEMHNLVNLRRALNLTVTDMLDGRIFANVIIEPALTGEAATKFQNHLNFK